MSEKCTSLFFFFNSFFVHEVPLVAADILFFFALSPLIKNSRAPPRSRWRK